VSKIKRIDNMDVKFDAVKNYEKTKKIVGYLSREKARPQDYYKMGFICGLEIHQQLKTEKKLFCRCPAGLYQKKMNMMLRLLDI